MKKLESLNSQAQITKFTIIITKMTPLTSGVYCLWNKITDQIYVGSSKNLSKRIKQHFSSSCQNLHLKSSIKKHGKDNFSIIWFETEDLFMEEQTLLDFVFANDIKTFNVAVKAGGNPGGSIEGQRKLSLKGKSREELRELSEAGGGLKRIPLFLIDTKTQVITQIESGCNGKRLDLGTRYNLSNCSKRNCLKRVKGCLVGRSAEDVKNKIEEWLLIPGNDTIDDPIILELPEKVKQVTLIKLAKVNPGHFSRMFQGVVNPSTGELRRFSMRSKADFNWYGTEVKAGIGSGV